jgi:DNA helicase-2/ATP-dependent DNA helicase PcrA
MTVHAAKGLEFDVVFISGLEQGLFPHENATLERDGLEEERRLMYVAVTRARHRLYLSHAQTRLLHGQTRYCLPSAFLDELPPNCCARSTRRHGRAPGGWPSAGKARPTGRSPGLRVGQNVRHARFGVGVIVSAEGSGPEARVQVNFGAGGMKWLALEYARLVRALSRAASARTGRPTKLLPCIGKGICPPIVWISLWKDCPCRVQVADSNGFFALAQKAGRRTRL